MDLAVQKSAGRQHHGARTKTDAHLRDRTHHPVAFDHQIIDGLLEQPELGLVFQHATDRGLVKNTVGLGASSTHGRPLGAVEDAELDAAFVGGQRHRAAQGVHLFDQMALANATNGRVAAHLPQRLDVVRQQQSFAAHACRSQRSFGSGMAATDHDHIEFLRVKHEKSALNEG